MTWSDILFHMEHKYNMPKSLDKHREIKKKRSSK